MYKAVDLNGDIYIVGMVVLAFNWDNYLTFGRNNFSSDSTACFRYVDTGEEINYTLSETGFNIRAQENRLIIFNAKMKETK